MKEEELRKGDTHMVDFEVIVALVALWAERSRYFFFYFQVSLVFVAEKKWNRI